MFLWKCAQTPGVAGGWRRKTEEQRQQLLKKKEDFGVKFHVYGLPSSVTSSGAAACLSVLSMGTATKKRKTKEMALANEKSHHHQEHAWEPSDIESLLKYVAEHFDHLDKKSASAVCMLMCLSSNPRARTCTCIPRDAEHCANGDQNGVRKHDANVNQNVEGWGKQMK